MKKYSYSFKQFVKRSISIAVFFFTIEITARIDDFIRYNAPLTGDYTASRLRTSDEDGIPHNIPYARFEKWMHNEYGFRGPDSPIKKPDNIFRIVCMGASESYGFYESPEKEWPAQLRSMFGKFPHIEVINTSVVGLPLKTYKAYLHKYVLKFAPDLVIVFTNPFHYATNWERKTSQTSQQQTRNDLQSGNKQKHSLQGLSLGGLISSSRSLPKIKQVIKLVIPPKLLKAYQTWDTQKQVNTAERLRLSGGKMPKDTISPATIESFTNDLSELIESLINGGIDVMLSTYPSLISKESIDEHYEIILDNRKFFVEFSFEGMMNVSLELNNAIKVVAAQHHVGLFDINQLLPKDLSYLTDNVHYTDEGATFIAEHVAQQIVRGFPQMARIPFVKNSHGGHE